MTGLETALLIATGAAVAYGSRKRGPAAKGSRRGRRAGLPRRSRLVVMYNASGAKELEADDAATAAAELAGRVVGAGARGGARSARAVRAACAKAGRAASRTSADRWERRHAARPAETVVDKWKTLHASRKSRLGERVRRVLRRLTPIKAVPDAPEDAAGRPREEPSQHPPPRPARPRPVPEPSPRPGETTTMSIPSTPETVAAPETTAAPADWAALIARVADFQPEDDVDLITWMKGEAAGVVAYAEAMESARQNCIADIGLDPSAVAGITVYSEHASELSARMGEALAVFLAVYGEVLGLAARGVVMPHNGRWMTGGTI